MLKGNLALSTCDLVGVMIRYGGYDEHMHQPPEGLYISLVIVVACILLLLILSSASRCDWT